jgi:Xaa-Pro aminopeptidase
MMHYSAKKDDCARLRPQGMLLVDCGGQYLRGTTDVTRTMALGPVTEDMRRHYTLTAVGNLQLLDAVFLYGCTGRNVDILARQPLWSTFVDYKCGTGHGIGYLLGVHEGPQNIRWRFAEGMAEAVLETGMIVSDEPGVYIEGEYGIRIETILEVVEAAKNGDGRFLRFSPLTLVPLDRALIDPAFLTPQTRGVLNSYHARVYAEIAPLLNEEERRWLRTQTDPI